MTDAETKAAATKARRPQPAARRHSAQPPWMEPILADWRTRWPAAFTKPVPLAIGISVRISEVLRAEGKPLTRKSVGLVLHHWTVQNSYLQAVLRGEARRNLDGSEAGPPNDAARDYAQRMLDERTAKRAGRERQQWAKRQAAEAAVSPTQVDHTGSS